MVHTVALNLFTFVIKLLAVKSLYIIFTYFIFTIFVSCTLYTDNEVSLKDIDDNDEIEAVKPAIKSNKQNVQLLNNNNLSEATIKLEAETKKIKAEIGTLLETF